MALRQHRDECRLWASLRCVLCRARDAACMPHVRKRRCKETSAPVCMRARADIDTAHARASLHRQSTDCRRVSQQPPSL